MDASTAVELVDMRDASEVKSSGRGRAIAGGVPDGFAGNTAIGDPELGVLAFASDALGGAFVGEVRDDELDGGIALTGWPQAIQFDDLFFRQFGESCGSVQTERRVELFRA